MKLKDILWGPYQLCVYFFVGVVLYALSVEASAKTYIEWKNQAKFLNLNESIETTDHLRLGHKWKNNFYFEAGPRTSGFSAEAGYKIKILPKFVLKGKIESNKTDTWKHGLETELRYTFGK